MPKAENLTIDRLRIDLENFRTVSQKSETAAVHSMIALGGKRFWGITRSLLENGVLPEENILAIRGDNDPAELTVREGNRRVAALKLIHGLLKRQGISVPPDIQLLIDAASPEWKAANKAFPGIVYDSSEADLVDRAVALIHGKAEEAGRSDWQAIARARHNRKANSASEPSLDLFEKYLDVGKNITTEERESWAGDYAITVLEEALQKLAPRMGLANIRELADKYPKVTQRKELDAVVRAIGLNELKFTSIRGSEDFAAPFGFPTLQRAPAAAGTTASGSSGAGAGGKGTVAGKPKAGAAKPKAASMKDPATVKAFLRRLTPIGPERAKVVMLKTEALKLNIQQTPLAFCFLLRCMFEISATVYCRLNAGKGGPGLKQKDGKDKSLVDVLRDITKHLAGDPPDQDVQKRLHPAMTELGRRDGLLSVRSMNHLIHNTAFVAIPSDVCVVFCHVYPLLESMNA